MTIQVQPEVILCKEKLDSYQNHQRCWCKILLTISSFFCCHTVRKPLTSGHEKKASTTKDSGKICYGNCLYVTNGQLYQAKTMQPTKQFQ